MKAATQHCFLQKDATHPWSEALPPFLELFFYLSLKNAKHHHQQRLFLPMYSFITLPQFESLAISIIYALHDQIYLAQTKNHPRLVN